MAYDHNSQNMRHYRVDKMAEITISGMDREGKDRYPDFQLARYGEKHFGMYAGQELNVTLRGHRSMVGVVLAMGPLQKLFFMVDITAVQWLIVIGLSLFALVMFEVTKFLRPLLRQLAGLPGS